MNYKLLCWSSFTRFKRSCMDRVGLNIRHDVEVDHVCTAYCNLIKSSISQVATLKIMHNCMVIDLLESTILQS
jgi:hypothetical protein